MAEPAKRSKTGWYLIGCVGLVVLMVPCMGIVAAVAIPSFVNYTRRAKTAEARANVAAIARGIQSYCAEEHVSLAGTMVGAGLPDAVGPSIAAPDAARHVQDFSAPGWTQVGFAPADPIYYAYSIVRPDGSTAIALAEGDLNGDGVRSRYAITCTRSGEGSLCMCGELAVTNELE